MHIWVTYVHMYTNMKFLCLTLWQGEVCTDDDDNDDANANNDANTNNDGQSMTV